MSALARTGLSKQRTKLSIRLKSALVFPVLIVSLFETDAVWACSFDVDCEVGSKCVKSSGSIYGVCMGGLFPGNKNDSEPVYDPLDLNGTVGNTCSFSVDCGPGNYCAKSPGAIDGVCVRAR